MDRVINFTNDGVVVGPDPLKARLDLWQKVLEGPLSSARPDPVPGLYARLSGAEPIGWGFRRDGGPSEEDYQWTSPI